MSFSGAFGNLRASARCRRQKSPISNFEVKFCHFSCFSVLRCGLLFLTAVDAILPQSNLSSGGLNCHRNHFWESKIDKNVFFMPKMTQKHPRNNPKHVSQLSVLLKQIKCTFWAFTNPKGAGPIFGPPIPPREVSTGRSPPPVRTRPWALKIF